MMTTKTLTWLVATVLVTGVPAMARDNLVTKDLTQFYGSIRLNLIETAELVPEADYAFKPTPEVRSIGQLIGHVANSQYFFCSSAAGESSPSSANYENDVTAKSALVEGLKESFEYCDGVYGSMTDAKLGELVGERTRMWGLAFNVAHNNEHYGNLVTYMRLKGIVPRSTARTQ